MKLPLKRFAFEVYDADNNIIADCGVGEHDQETMKDHADMIAEAINGLADTRRIQEALPELEKQRDAAIESATCATAALKEVVQAIKEHNEAKKKFDDTLFGTREEEGALNAYEAAEKRLDDLLAQHYHIITTGEPFKAKT